jgi:hypothetical protein
MNKEQTLIKNGPAPIYQRNIKHLLNSLTCYWQKCTIPCIRVIFGLAIHKTINWNIHIENKLSTKNKGCILHHASSRPLLEYSCTLWNPFTNVVNIQKLESAQRPIYHSVHHNSFTYCPLG